MQEWFGSHNTEFQECVLEKERFPLPPLSDPHPRHFVHKFAKASWH